MKSLLFLALVGAAIYAVLLYSNPLPDPNPSIVAVQAEETPPSGSHAGSWGSDIGSLKPQIVSVETPPVRWYDRKPSQPLRYVDENEAAASAGAPAASKPNTVTASKPVLQAKPELSSRVAVKKAAVRHPRWTRRAEKRARKAYGHRAFLLGR
ncbi:MAG: hypothetical protein FJX44_06060 [Alphaproteobacteria bacterium]|nr:hypothetical protein [Alphaproteobacteria bacterium]